eukprot:TCALIF_12023-PA protein Name:"Protein of unknown function" AED:0.20 eAED:0.24 QI:11/0/0.5/1/1/1/2/144/127
MNPPEPPLSFKLHPVWNGDPVSFGEDITYECESDFIDGVLDDQGDPLFSKLFFENERSQNVINVTCLEGGLFDIPNIWPKCVKTHSCPIVPVPPKASRLKYAPNHKDGSQVAQIMDSGIMFIKSFLA